MYIFSFPAYSCWQTCHVAQSFSKGSKIEQVHLLTLFAPEKHGWSKS